MLLAVGTQPVALAAGAETLKDWPVEGLLSEPEGVVTVALPPDPNAAAGILLHKLENQGYPLAEVRIVDDRLVVTYGEVVAVETRGLDGEVEDLVQSYLRNLVGTSPTTDQLSHAIMLINDIPGMSASVQLVRLDDLGHYKAVVSGAQRQQAGAFSVRNTPTTEFESREASLHQEVYSALLGGDIIRLDATAIDGDGGDLAYALQVSHEFPIDNDGTFVEARVSHFEASGENDFEPGQSFDSSATSGALVIGHAFKRFVEVADYAYAEFDYRAEDNGDLGSADYGIARAAFFESYHDDHGTTVSWSVSLSGGSELSDPDQKFAVMRGGAGLIFWLPELSDSAEIRVETSGQIGSRNTPGFELFSFGGANRQRGFAPYEYAGNHGADLTLELADTYQPWGAGTPLVTPYVFTDATYVANTASAVSQGRPDHNEILSAGIGSKVSFSNGFSINSWLAVPLYDGQRADRPNDIEFYLQGQLTW